MAKIISIKYLELVGKEPLQWIHRFMSREMPETVVK